MMTFGHMMISADLFGHANSDDLRTHKDHGADLSVTQKRSVLTLGHTKMISVDLSWTRKQ